jgi:hypothetical protein
MYFNIQVLVIKENVCFYHREWILSLAPESVGQHYFYAFLKFQLGVFELFVGLKCGLPVGEDQSLNYKYWILFLLHFHLLCVSYKYA